MGIRINIVAQLFNGWFLLFVGLYLGQLAFAANGWSTPILQHYLGDVLAFPILLHLITISVRLVLNEASFRPDWTMLLSLWILLVVVFEGLLPLYHPRYTADYWDVLAYALGWVIARSTILH